MLACIKLFAPLFVLGVMTPQPSFVSVGRQASQSIPTMLHQPSQPVLTTVVPLYPHFVLPLDRFDRESQLSIQSAVNEVVKRLQLYPPQELKNQLFGWKDRASYPRNIQIEVLITTSDSPRFKDQGGPLENPPPNSALAIKRLPDPLTGVTTLFVVILLDGWQTHPAERLKAALQYWLSFSLFGPGQDFLENPYARDLENPTADKETLYMTRVLDHIDRVLNESDARLEAALREQLLVQKAQIKAWLQE